MIYALTLMREVQSGNTLAYKHWRFRMKDRDHWKFLLQDALARNPIPAAIGKRSVHITFYRRYRLDDDNASSGFKHGRDCLVRAGLLKDDNREWSSFVYEQRKSKEHESKKPCTVITIEDVA